MSFANQKKLVTIVYKKHIFIGVHTHFAISIQTWYDIRCFKICFDWTKLFETSIFEEWVPFSIY